MSKNGAFAVTWISGLFFFITANTAVGFRSQAYLNGVAQGLFSASIVVLFIKEES